MRVCLGLALAGLIVTPGLGAAQILPPASQYEALDAAREAAAEAAVEAVDVTARPKRVCKTFKVTGSRVREATLCRSPREARRVDRGAHRRGREALSDVERELENIKNPLPSTGGG